MTVFICYPKCSTCQRAQKWLREKGITFRERHIVSETPTVDELTAWIARSGKPLKSFFNTSGLVYRRLGLTEHLKTLSPTEQVALLASDGMLIRRPLLITDKAVLVGFREKEWTDTVK